MNDTAALVEYARRSHDNAERTANAALRMEQTAARMERELGEVRRDIRKLTEVVGVLTVAPKPRHISKSKFNPSDTGSHFMVPAEDLDELLEKRQQREDATAYRRLWKRVRVLVLALGTGAATLGGEQLVKWLLHL